MIDPKEPQDLKRRVRYTNHDGKVDYGTITAITDNFVFVRYDYQVPEGYGQATYRSNLEWAEEGESDEPIRKYVRWHHNGKTIVERPDDFLSSAREIIDGDFVDASESKCAFEIIYLKDSEYLKLSEFKGF